MSVNQFYFFSQVLQSLKRQALPGSLLASSIPFLEEKKNENSSKNSCFFRATQSADANDYGHDDAIFEFLTGDDVKRSMGERR